MVEVGVERLYVLEPLVVEGGSASPFEVAEKGSTVHVDWKMT